MPEPHSTRPRYRNTHKLSTLRHIPEPLPDELASGHLGRLYLLNGITPTKRQITSTIHSLTDYQGSSYIDTLALLSGLSFSHYVFHHTLLPFFRAVQAESPKAWNMVDPSDSWVQPSANRAHPLGALLCPHCVEEDMTFWGFSYWRRTHQLPGLGVCLKHQTALLRTDSDSLTRKLPQNALSKAEALPPELTTLAMQNPTIRRYHDICSEFLYRKRSISTTQMVTCLQGRARQIQIRPRAGVPGLHLHDTAHRLAGGEWLSTNFPDIERKGSSSSLSRTYTSRKVAYATPYYALALALLYESADEAFNHLDTVDELSGLLKFQMPPQQTPSEAEDGHPTRLQHALNNFLGGAPLDQACIQAGAERQALEKLLRLATKHALSTERRI